jgi:putative FmdB family regulatory protein
MPIYEYRCNQCGKRLSALVRNFDERDTAVSRCPRCGSHDVRRLMSRITVVRSEESRMESLADPSSFGDLDENDPRSMGRWMRHMGREMGEDLGPEFDEVVGRLEAGESPESIEESMPDLGGAAAGDSLSDDMDF